jgi:hypothetical protein
MAYYTVKFTIITFLNFGKSLAGIAFRFIA